MYKRTAHTFFLSKQIAEIQERQIPPLAGNAAFILWINQSLSPLDWQRIRTWDGEDSATEISAGDRSTSWPDAT
jgi:hypothetical protein